MANRIHENIAIAVFRLICGVILLVGLSGCAAVGHNAASSRWACDAPSDAAVDREDWSQALAGHEQYLLKHPTNCLTMYHLGFIWGKLEDRAKEIHFYKQAISCGYVDDDRIFFNLGMAYRDRGEFDAALAAFERAIAIQPKEADDYFGFGLTAREAGHPQRALKALKRAVALDPNHWYARLELARLFLDQSQWAKAQAQLEIVRKGDPGNADAQAVWEQLQSLRALEYDH